MRESTIEVLLEGAASGAGFAWQEIVRRYSPLVYSRCRRFGLTASDADDVAGTVWLRLVASLGTLREPAALPGWLATTTRRECLALIRDRGRQIPVENVDRVEPDTTDPLVEQEKRAAVRAALTCLSDRDKELLTLLFRDPPMSYVEISSNLGMPIGAIGPTRQRCLARVRRIPSVAALMRDESHRRTA